MVSQKNLSFEMYSLFCVASNSMRMKLVRRRVW